MGAANSTSVQLLDVAESGSWLVWLTACNDRPHYCGSAFLGLQTRRRSPPEVANYRRNSDPQERDRKKFEAQFRRRSTDLDRVQAWIRVMSRTVLPVKRDRKTRRIDCSESSLLVSVLSALSNRQEHQTSKAPSGCTRDIPIGGEGLSSCLPPNPREKEEPGHTIFQIVLFFNHAR